jgi:2'-5' RNA ligase
MRLFTAIELPEPVRRHLFDVAAELRRQLEAGSGRRPAVSWTKEPNLHVTLKFLGEVPDARVPSVCDALRAVKQNPPALRLHAEGVDTFPSRNAVRIIHAKVAGDADRLAALYDAIEARCAALGFPRENRRFRPHVTIGRPREPLRGVWGTLEQAASGRFPGPEFHATSFSLVQSRLSPAGAIYSTVATFPAFA